MALRRIVQTLFLGLLTALGAQRASAVTFEVVDLPDAVVGVDLMKYVYHLEGSFGAFEGFNLLFDPAKHAELSVITPLGSNWDHVTTQPNASAPLDGVVSTMALSGIGNATGTFEVGFTRIAAGVPGAQPIEFFDDSFNITSTAITTAFVSGVPEPSTNALMLVGILVLARTVRRRHLAPLPATLA